MKKFLAMVAMAPFAVFAEGSNIDLTAVDTLITEAKTSMASFISTNAPVIGGIAFSLLVFTLIFVGLKLMKRTAKSA